MTLSRRWTRDLTPMRRLMNRFFDEDLPRFEGWPLTAITTPDIPLDILDRDDELVVKASLPGLKPADLHVEVDDDSLRIWGEVKEEHQQEEGNYYLREHRYGRIERMTSLPVPVEADQAKAEFEDGMLTLTLPKASEARRKEIQVISK